MHNADEFEVESILMLKNINKLQNVDACLHILASNCLLNHVCMHYESNRIACIIRMAIASNRTEYILNIQVIIQY